MCIKIPNMIFSRLSVFLVFICFGIAERLRRSLFVRSFCVRWFFFVVPGCMKTKYNYSVLILVLFSSLLNLLRKRSFGKELQIFDSYLLVRNFELKTFCLTLMIKLSWRIAWKVIIQYKHIGIHNGQKKATLSEKIVFRRKWRR